MKYLIVVFKVSVFATLLATLLAEGVGYSGDLAILARDMFLWFFGMGVTADLLSDLLSDWSESKEDAKFSDSLGKLGGVPATMLRKETIDRLIQKNLVRVDDRGWVVKD